MTGFDTVAVVGAGLIGGSVARRLQDLGREVVVVDPDPSTRAAAAEAGLVVAGAVPAATRLVVLATPLDALAAAMADVADSAPEAVVVDVGSVKAAAEVAASSAGLDGRHVGAHPMAGTELSGFDHSDAALLVHVTWAVTRGPGPVGDVVRWLAEVFEATVLVLDADEHDRAVALVSHAPHAVANALLEAVELATDSPAARHLAAGSFRDGTRVAGRNPARSRNMLADNAAALGPVLDDLVASLQAYRRELGDRDALGRRLAEVAEAAPGVRRPAVEWRPCPDLEAVLSGPGPVLVRQGAGTLEWATSA